MAYIQKASHEFHFNVANILQTLVNLNYLTRTQSLEPDQVILYTSLTSQKLADLTRLVRFLPLLDS